MPGFNMGNGPSFTEEPFMKHRWQIIKLGPTEVYRYARTMQLPNFDVRTKDVRGASIIYKFAESVEWQPVKLSFYDTKAVYQQLEDWRQKVWSIDNGISPATDYCEESFIPLNEEQLLEE